jgi:hypothetical protein
MKVTEATLPTSSSLSLRAAASSSTGFVHVGGHLVLGLKVGYDPVYVYRQQRKAAHEQQVDTIMQTVAKDIRPCRKNAAYAFLKVIAILFMLMLLYQPFPSLTSSPLAILITLLANWLQGPSRA